MITKSPAGRRHGTAAAMLILIVALVAIASFSLAQTNDLVIDSSQYGTHTLTLAPTNNVTDADNTSGSSGRGASEGDTGILDSGTSDTGSGLTDVTGLATGTDGATDASEDTAPAAETPPARPRLLDRELITTETATRSGGTGGVGGSPVCDDIMILINGEPLGETTTLGQEFSVTLGVGPNVLPGRVVIQSDNPVIKRVINKAFNSVPVIRSPGCVNYTQRFKLSSMFPGGSFPITIKMLYSDATLTKRTFDATTTIVVPGGSGWLSGDTSDLLSALMSGPPPRLAREFLPDEYDGEDLEALGITLEDYLKGIALLRQGDEEGAKKLLGDIREIWKSNRTMTPDDEDNVAEALRERFKKAITASIGVEPEVESRVFEIEHDGKTLTKSRIIVNMPAGFTMSKGEMVVYIPKEIASSVDEIVFSDEPDEIIETDPVVKWAFSNVPQDQYREYGMTVNGDAQNFEVVAKAAANKPSLMTRFIVWLLGVFS